MKSLIIWTTIGFTIFVATGAVSPPVSPPRDVAENGRYQITGATFSRTGGKDEPIVEHIVLKIDSRTGQTWWLSSGPATINDQRIVVTGWGEISNMKEAMNDAANLVNAIKKLQGKKAE